MHTRLEGDYQQHSEPDSRSPLVSILVVVFNACQDLPTLIESILDRKSDDIELIVIDGGSKDGTVEYLRTLGAKIDYWLSEPDRGIYDAMNKAFVHARGMFLLHLNAGDGLLHIPREELERARDTKVDIISFRVILGERGEFWPCYGWQLRFYNTLHHQGTFYRRTSFPGYDTRLRIFADFDVNQRLALAGAHAVLGREVVAFHAIDGISAQKNKLAVAEFLFVIYKNYGVAAVLIARLVGKWHGFKDKLKLLKQRG